MIRKPAREQTRALYQGQREQAEQKHLEHISDRTDALVKLVAPLGHNLWVRLACVCTAAICAELRSLR